MRDKLSKKCGWKRHVHYHAQCLQESYCYTLLPVVFERLQSTFNHHHHLSIDSADNGTNLHKTDGSCAR